MIQNIVKNEVFPMIGQGKVSEAEKHLKKLMMTLTEKKSTEDYRIVLCNLARLRFIQGDISNAKHYILRFKDRLSRDSGYTKEYMDRYCDYLNLYAEVFTDELTKEEKISINKINYNNAIKNNDIARILMARSNIAILEDDFDEIEDLLIDIHNYENSKMLNTNDIENLTTWVMTEESLEEIKYVKSEIFRDIKNKYPDYMKNYNCAY